MLLIKNRARSNKNSEEQPWLLFFQVGNKLNWCQMVLRIGSSSDISSFKRMNESLKGFALFWPNKRAPCRFDINIKYGWLNVLQIWNWFMVPQFNKIQYWFTSDESVFAFVLEYTFLLGTVLICKTGGLLDRKMRGLLQGSSSVTRPWHKMPLNVKKLQHFHGSLKKKDQIL